MVFAVLWQPVIRPVAGTRQTDYTNFKTEVVGEVFACPANERLMEKLSDGFIHTYVLMWVCVFQRR